MKLDARAADFIEGVGVAMQPLGAAPTAGRLLGLLLLGEKPVSLDEACRLLGASKGPVSTHARKLLSVGLVQRVRYPRDRRDYYEAAPGTLERLLTPRLGLAGDWGRLAASGLDAAKPGNTVTRARLAEMRDMCEFLAGEMAAMLDRWQAARGRLP